MIRRLICGIARDLELFGVGRAWVASSDDGSVGLDWCIGSLRVLFTWCASGRFEWCRA